jgi:hypothetical protein
MGKIMKNKILFHGSKKMAAKSTAETAPDAPTEL